MGRREKAENFEPYNTTLSKDHAALKESKDPPLLEEEMPKWPLLSSNLEMGLERRLGKRTEIAFLETTHKSLSASSLPSTKYALRWNSNKTLRTEIKIYKACIKTRMY